MNLYDVEPTAADLDEIEAEWPVIEAELGVLDAEIAAASHPGRPTTMDWRRLRRAEHQLMTVCARHARAAMILDDMAEVA